MAWSFVGSDTFLDSEGQKSKSIPSLHFLGAQVVLRRGVSVLWQWKWIRGEGVAASANIVIVIQRRKGEQRTGERREDSSLDPI